MPEHELVLHRHDSPFPGDVVEITLAALARHVAGFFPCSMAVAPGRSVPVRHPGEFDRSLVPAEFTIEPGVSVRIPLDGADGSELAIVDDRAPDATPATVVLVWPELATLPDSDALLALLAELTERLAPTVAYITDSDAPLSDPIYPRSFQVDPRLRPVALYWITWLSPAHLATLGAAVAPLRALEGARPVGGGLLLRLCDRPEDAAAVRAELEPLVGLR